MQNKKYLLNAGIKRAQQSRLLAKLIDSICIILLSFFYYPLGLLIGLFYLSISDSLYQGQSFGKKFMGFAVVSIQDGNPCSFKQSFIRNLPFIIPLFFSIIPVWGWFVAILTGIPFLALEFYLMMRLDSAHRLGDVMADTTVINIIHDGHKVKNPTKSWYDPEKVTHS